MIDHDASVVGHMKGATKEKQFITYGMGMQILRSIGANKTKKGHIWETIA